MKLHDLLGRWLRRPVAARLPAPRRRGPRVSLEQLEDRTVPSSFTAATVSDLIADINAANLTGGSNAITQVAGTTFTLNAVDNNTDGPTGLPVIAANDNLTILGNGDTIERSMATGTPAFRLFDVAAAASLTLENLTLQGGLAVSLARGTGAVAQGGAVYNQGRLTLESVTVQNNTAQGPDGVQAPEFGFAAGDAAGGGLYSSGVLTIENSTLSNNSAIGGRGGDGTPQFHLASDGGDGLGGGLYAAGGIVTLYNSTVTANVAQGGAGGTAYNRHSFDGKPGQGFGGGLYIDGAASVFLDAFTQKHVKKNQASTNDNNIYGSYDVIS
jgi:hypothetical protein